MELDILRDFVSLANCLNFSQAARARFISQPSLSKHISFLEDQLQVPLFIRSRQSVELTEAGELFLESAKAVLRDYDAGLERLHDYRNGLAGHLNIAYLNNALPPYFFEAVKHFNETYPKVELAFSTYHDLGSIFRALRNGEADVILTIWTHDLDSAKLVYGRLCSFPICVCIGAENPLSERKTLLPEDLRDCVWFMGDPESLIGHLDVFRGWGVSQGFTPNMRFHKVGVSTVGLVQLGQGVSFFFRGALPLPDCDGVRYVDLNPEQYHVDAVVAWDPKNANPSAEAFTRLLAAYGPKSEGEKS